MAEITLQIPEELYEQLVNKAATSHQPLDAVALQSLRIGMPPDLKHVPARFLPDLESLDMVDDSVIWQVAQAELTDDKAQLYEELLDKNQHEQLEPSEASRLETLREEADVLMLRRSYAYALLKWRGHRIPSAVGRATVIAIRLNNDEIVASRSLWVQAGWHPPAD